MLSRHFFIMAVGSIDSNLHADITVPQAHLHCSVSSSFAELPTPQRCTSGQERRVPWSRSATTAAVWSLLVTASYLDIQWTDAF